MATRTFTTDRGGSPRVVYVQWSGLLNGDDGSPVALPAMDLVSFQVTGTPGAGGSIQMEATNEATPANWAILGAAVTAVGMTYPADFAVARNFRPRVTAGDGTTSLVVNACFRLP